MFTQWCLRATRGLGARALLTTALVTLLAFSAYGTLLPGGVRCGLPGAVGCPGGILGPALAPAASGEQWFTVTMYDWGFWVADSTTGANETQAWNVFEGWTIHINATSLAPDAAIGGTAYHGLGVEINATGQQLMSLAAPVGTWTQGSFVAPSAEYHHQHIWCTISCGPGHGSQQAWILNVIPALPTPVASAKANVTSGPAPLSVSLTGTATLGTPPYNISWDFGDGSPAIYALSTNHSYSLGGAYAARFQVTDVNGMTALATINIVVNSTAPLTARATSTAGAGVTPLSAGLSVVAHGGVPPYSFEWSFGDGQFLNGTNATQHLFLSPGLFAIVVTVRDSAGASVRALASVAALPPAGTFPVAVTVTPTNGSPPLAVKYLATPGGGVAPYSYLWVFGDGFTGIGANASHQYNQTGSYVAAVFVKDAVSHVGLGMITLPVTTYSGGGGGDDLPQGVATPSAPASGLVVRLLTSPNEGGSPLTVNATASIEGGSGTNESISWNFGDGTTASGAIVSHQFAAVGRYDVSVTATDSAATTGSNWTWVTVEPLGMKVEVDRTAGDDPFTLGAAATILGGTGRYSAVNWSWGDGASSTGNLTNHTYAPNFTGIATLHASTTDSSGAAINASISIQVYPRLEATLRVAIPKTQTSPVNVGFTLTVSGGSGGYLSSPFWNFGDGNNLEAGSATVHPYSKQGHYAVTVTTNDSVGTPVTTLVWVNLSLTSTGGGGGAPPWSLTGVSDPNRVALILIGLVAASGLILVRRKQSKKAPASPTKKPQPKSVVAAEGASPPAEPGR